MVDYIVSSVSSNLLTQLMMNNLLSLWKMVRFEPGQ